MTRSIFRFIIAVVVIFIYDVKIVYAGYSATVNGVKWYYNVERDDTATLNDSINSPRCISTDTAGIIAIPSSLGGHVVKTIGSSAFSGCSKVTSITIPSSVTKIEYSAFYNCTGLISITIPETVRSIGSGIFKGCTNLKRVEFPNWMTELPQATFNGCKNLEGLDNLEMLPSAATTISDYCFEDCNFTTLRIPKRITSIGTYAFSDMHGVKTVILPASLQTIGYSAFYSSGTPSYTMYIPTTYNGQLQIRYPAYVTCIRYVPVQTVTLDATGGEVSPQSMTVDFYEPYGDIPTPTRKGWTFAGWGKDGTTILSDTIVTALADHTLSASWTTNEYTITFNGQGAVGSMDEIEMSYDEPVTLPPCAFTKNDGTFVFDGWATNETDLTPVFAECAIVSNLTDEANGIVTLYAVWEELVAPVIRPADGSTFPGEFCDVSISCATKDSVIYFSTNGVNPRQADAFRYANPFTISDTTVVKAFAVRDGKRSNLTTSTITKRTLSLADAAGAPQLSFTTDGAANWTPIADETTASGLSVRSGAIPAADSGTIETRLAVTVNGAGTFTFNWKVDCEHDDFGTCSWDRLMVYTNGAEAAKMDGITEWLPMSFRFADNGTNTVCWIFLRDDYDDPGAEYANCGWVSGVSWTPSAIIVPVAVTGTKDVEIPQDWPDCFEGFTTAFGADKEAAMRKPTGKTDADGNPMYVWQDYVAGTDPTDMDSRFTATISMSNDVPYITWSPNLNTNGIERIYTVLGKTNLTDMANWAPTNSAHRVFKVKVEMP